MIYIVEHECEFLPLGKTWDVQKRMLTPNARRVYERIRDISFIQTDRPITAHLLAHQVGMSRTALTIALHILEAENYVSEFVEDDLVTVITVSPPPPLTAADEEAFDTAGADRRENETVKARKLVAHWSALFEKNIGAGYDGRMIDRRQALRLLKSDPDMRYIEGVMQFFWRHGDSTEKVTFASFARDFNEIAAQKRELEEGLV